MALLLLRHYKQADDGPVHYNNGVMHFGPHLVLHDADILEAAANS